MSLESNTLIDSIPEPVHKTAAQINQHHQPDSNTNSEVERIKQKTRMRKLRELQLLAERVKIGPDGERTFIRFSTLQRAEHYLLIASFGSLVITGLLQTFSWISIIGWGIQVLGGIDGIRAVHHLAAVILILQSVYHVVQILIMWVVKRKRGAMWPSLRDFTSLFQMIFYNMGLVKKKPEFDHFSIDEKLEYWAMLWGTPLMIFTGLIIWFPVIFTKYFPGVIIPISLTIHRWEAILAALAILTWHMYHTNIKEVNRSIFTGTMSEEEMQHGHLLEYKRIMAAYDFIQKNNKSKND